MSIVTRTQALKKLYKAVVGEDTTKNDPTKIISELADNWSGGGGSSDFSTATVTVTANGEFRLPNAVIIDSGDEMLPTDGGTFETGTYTLVLYKGGSESSIAGTEGFHITNAEGTGGVSVSTSPIGYSVVITDDGTLSVTLAS